MITCRRAAAWISRDLDASLAAPAKLVLWTHLATCAKCQRFRRQLDVIDRMAAEWLHSGAAGRGDGRLSDDVASEIARRCREAGR